ncbi:MAG: hypothetical protein ACK559_37390, partial [bacterium]
ARSAADLADAHLAVEAELQRGGRRAGGVVDRDGLAGLQHAALEPGTVVRGRREERGVQVVQHHRVVARDDGVDRRAGVARREDLGQVEAGPRREGHAHGLADRGGDGAG